MVVGIYAQTLAFELLSWDDGLLITDNPYFRLPLLTAVSNLLQDGYAGIFIPLSFVSWKIQYVLASTADPSRPLPWVFHLTSVLLMTGTVWQVHRLSVRLVGAGWPAFLGAALFAVHPVQVESAAWVSEQKGLWSLFLGVAAIRAYMHAAASATLIETIERWLLATSLFALALLAKPWAVVLPVWAILLDRGFLRRPVGKVLGLTAGWFVLAGVFVMFTQSVQGKYILQSVPLGERAFVAAHSLGHYASKVLWPMPLAPDYGHPVGRLLEGVTPTAHALAWGFWLVFLALGLVWLARPSRWGAAILLAIVGLAPTLGFVPFAYQLVSTVADRYMLPAMVGVGLVFALLAERINSRLAALVGMGLVLGLGAISFFQCGYWRNDVALVNHALNINEESTPFLVTRSRLALDAGRVEEAEVDARRALMVRPGYTHALINLATAYQRQRKIDSAIRALEQVIEQTPDDGLIVKQLASLQVGIGRYVDAVQTLRAFDAISPGAVTPLLGQALILSGKEREGINLLTGGQSARMNSASTDFLVSQVLEGAGEFSLAIERLRKILQSYPESPEARSRLAWILATTPDDRVRQGPEAMELSATIPRAGRSGAPGMVIRAAVLAEVGQYEEASKLIRQAIALRQEADEDVDPEWLTMQQRFEAKQPHRAKDPRLVNSEDP
jgi:tetratricopeptide (TPR) repeat protein